MLSKRSSGILMHFSSLPGQYGIGDLGWPTLDFIDFLERAGQSFWQFLPTVPGDMIHCGSPYMGLSAIAGNPLLISPDILQEDGLLTMDDIGNRPEFSEYLVDYKQISEFKSSLLSRAFERFKRQTNKYNFDKFCKLESSWLDEYALFMSIRETQFGKAWNQWPADVANRKKIALKEAAWTLSSRLEYYKFEQFCFFKQWDLMRNHARQKGIKLIGDIPIYVSYDSVDVWANQNCFKLNKKSLAPTHVAGVPPDYFSKTGQRWGNPIYKWKIGNKKNESLYSWWCSRFKQIGRVVDVVRIDHFRGFESFWEIPASNETAVHGVWRKGPGKQFFKEMNLNAEKLAVIAEDLGVITPEVEKLRNGMEFPGMKILQFAFDSDNKNNYLPHNYNSPDCIVYTGTHDNDTTLGWFMGDDTSPESKLKAKRYANSRDDSQIHWDFIRMAFASIASVAIIPMQDILGFGEDCRMNTPGTSVGNWQWRCAPRFINNDVAQRLKNETNFYGRISFDKSRPQT